MILGAAANSIMGDEVVRLSESIHGRSARSMSTETLPCHAERSLRSEASRLSSS